MRHRVSGKKLGRDTKHRIALFKNLARGLILHGTVTTTEIKGKELKSLADRLVGMAKTDSLTSRRTLHRYFGKRDIVNTLVDRVAPAFTDRVSGFTRIEKSGIRVGDNTSMVTVSWVNKPESVGSFANPNPAPKTVAAKKTVATKTEKIEKKPVAKKTAAPAKTEATKEVKPKAAKKPATVKKTK
jgi:large subunit ribosomal protein L17